MQDPINAAISDPKKHASLARRMAEKVAKSAPNDCWEWQAKARCNGGYGAINAGRGPTLRAHRVAWALCNGPIPEDRIIRHKCDNPPCCNPDHLLLGDQWQNTEDMRSRGRWSPPPIHAGESHYLAKVPNSAIASIKADPRSHAEVAADFGVSYKTIYRLRKGVDRWKLAPKGSNY